VHLEAYNAKHAQFKILPRYKVKSEGEFVSAFVSRYLLCEIVDIVLRDSRYGLAACSKVVSYLISCGAGW